MSFTGMYRSDSLMADSEQCTATDSGKYCLNRFMSMNAVVCCTGIQKHCSADGVIQAVLMESSHCLASQGTNFFTIVVH